MEQESQGPHRMGRGRGRGGGGGRGGGCMVSKRDLGADCLRTGERELASQEAEGVWLAAPTNPAPWRGGGSPVSR